MKQNYTLAPNDDARKKLQFMNVIQHAAYSEKPLYRQTKEEIQKSLPKL